MDFRWHQIETFIEVARCPSFASAAEKLYITAPALIQQMNTLERSLGFALFVRKHDGISLTSAGEVFYQGIVGSAEQIEQLVTDCQQIASKVSVVRIGGYSAFETDFLRYGLMLRLASQYPSIKIEVIPTSRSTVLEDCLLGKLDIAEYYDEELARAAGLEYTSCLVGNVSIVMSRENELTRLGSVRAKDLHGYTVLVDVNHFSERVGAWLDVSDSNEAPLKVEHVPLNLETVIQRCNEGCVAMFPSYRADVFHPLTSRPVNPPINYLGGYIMRKNASREARQVAEFLLSETRM